ncbi:glycosyltransferase, partial [candidate division KSB3 bacterium]|nr:glycosyltransferase [candidate division KSB3 bacterium]MBD3325577.1 glycosyltransferase [candidate division KSB3 bacterium]
MVSGRRRLLFYRSSISCRAFPVDLCGRIFVCRRLVRPFANTRRTMTSSPRSQDARWLFWISGLGVTGVNVWMAGIGNIGKRTPLFSLLYVLAFLLLFVLIRYFPHEWPERKQWAVILGLSLVTRFAFLAFPASGDTCRYIWEGYLLNQGVNPFFVPPDSPEVAPFVEDLQEIWQGINHKNATACYPPLSMLIFRLAAALSPTKAFFNLVIIAFDVATVWILARLVRMLHLPLQRVLIYALNPLVLVFLAGEGHLDAIQNFFIWLGVYWLFCHRDGRAFFSFGCAVMSKYFSVMFVPFLVNKRTWKALAVFAGTIFVLYLPFWDTGLHLFASLKPFGLTMHYNDFLTVFLRDWFGSYATLLSLLLFAMGWGLIFLLVHDPLKSCYLAAGWLLLLLPTLHVWYLVLITPFLVFFPSRGWLYLHVAVVFTFPVLHYLHYTGVFQEIHWIKWFEYLPFYGLVLWDAWRDRPYWGDRRFRPVHTLSVIIPTLNEARYIEPCLRSIQGEPAVVETIVVDGGSTDRTQAIAQQFDVRLIQAPKGRGRQIRAGVAQARGDVILILHADCTLKERTPGRIMRALQQHPQRIGGSVRMQYQHRPIGSRCIEWLNNGRARWMGIAFGDQAQFFRREALPLIGGFPDLMLMEDVELSLRLKAQGSLCVL